MINWSLVEGKPNHEISTYSGAIANNNGWCMENWNTSTPLIKPDCRSYGPFISMTYQFSRTARYISLQKCLEASKKNVLRLVTPFFLRHPPAVPSFGADFSSADWTEVGHRYVTQYQLRVRMKGETHKVPPRCGGSRAVRDVFFLVTNTAPTKGVVFSGGKGQSIHFPIQYHSIWGFPKKLFP